MSDQPRKPAAKLHSLVPEDVREFVRCRRDSIDIKAQAIDIPKTVDIIGGQSFDLSFEDDGKGSITIKLDGPGMLDVTIPVSIKDGHLAADTSGIFFGRAFVDDWIRDFNADLDAPPAKQLAGVSVKNGSLHVTKRKVASTTKTAAAAVAPPPMSPQEPSHPADNPIPEPVEAVTTDSPATAIPDTPPPPPPPDHVVDPIPPPVKVENEEVVTTTGSVPDLDDLGTDAVSGVDLEEVESGFIERPPISRQARLLRGMAPKVVTGVVGLGVIAFLLFSNLGGDSPEVVPTDPPGQSSEEPAADDEPVADEEPVSNSVQVTDPAGDNGGEGSGADILGLEYVDDGAPMVRLTMKDSPLTSSIEWYSYYLEVTFKRTSGATHVVIWENHAGSSRWGALDSSGNSNGEGVNLTDAVAELQTHADPDDPVVGVCVKAFSLVEQDSVFTQDEMEVEFGTG